MSYILEALKKAQAERQLGNSPTIHAPTLQAGAQASASGRLKRPVVLALVAMAVAIVVLVVLVLRSATPVVTADATAPAASGDTVAATLPQPPTAAQQSAAVQRSAAMQPSSTAQQSVAALPAPVTALPPPVATVTTPLAQPATPVAAPAPATTAAPASATRSAPAPAAAAVAKVEEPVVNLHELPEPIQRAIPQVAVGGYIYSKNPADRLLLVDKILRREGEEVAPGLLLEKLNPKEAVFSYKGYRYRVPY